MAARTEIYRARINLSDTDHGHYEQMETTLALHPSETAKRLVTRLLAFALCHEEGLAFTRGVSTGDEPDIWRHDDTGALQHWIEVGLPEAARLIKAGHHCPKVSLFLQGHKREQWDNEQRSELDGHEKISVWAFDEAFIEQLAGLLDRNLQWELTLSGGHLFLSQGDQTLDCSLQHLAGPDSLRGNS